LDNTIDEIFVYVRRLIDENTSWRTTRPTVDRQSQTDAPTHDKQTLINMKLKRALQTIKERVHRLVIEQAELFGDVGDDTIERLDRLISMFTRQVERQQQMPEPNERHDRPSGNVTVDEHTSQVDATPANDRVQFDGQLAV
jgi:hypothetical protein